MDKISGLSGKLVIIVFVVGFIGFLIGKSMKKDSNLDPLIQAIDETGQSNNSETVTDSTQQ